MRIGIDVDGCLANFFQAYESLFVEVAGVDKFPARYPHALPPVWNWPEHYGYSDETATEVWRRIKNDPTFWLKLGPLPDTVRFLQNLDTITGPDDQVYFITDRPGRWVQDQTTQWLRQMGWAHPAVVISAPAVSKGQVCAGLGIDFYLDDKGENIIDVLDRSKATRAALLAHPYNATFQPTVCERGASCVRTVGEFLDIIGS